MAVTLTQVLVPITPSTVALPIVPAGATMTLSVTATNDFYTTTQAYGNVVAPVAGGTIVTFGSLSAGSYDISIFTHVWGTGASTVENNNMQLTGVPGGPLTLIVDGGTGTTPIEQTFQFTSSTSFSPAVTALANASASTNYSACLKATPHASDVYVGMNSAVTPTNGMQVGKPGTLTINNPPGASKITMWATSRIRTHTISAMVITPS